jgi:Domain of unknown function (DUF222)/HNH endonuclease
VRLPRAVAGTAARTSLHDAGRVVERTKTVAQAPAFGEAIEQGRVSAGHVDALGKALRSLPDAAKDRLLGKAAELALVAGQSTVAEFGKRLRHETQRLMSDGDREAQLERQKRQTRLVTWVDRDNGMGRWTAIWDPETMVTLEAKLDAMVERLFHAAHPTNAPSDPVDKQQFLRAHALLAIIEGGGVTLSRAEAVIVARDGGDGTAVIDYDLPFDLPASVIRRHAERARITVVVVNDGDVVAAPGPLNLGRSERFADRAQRRAHRAIYSQCAVPGCAVPYSHTEAHHVVPYEQGGRTDLDNLIPICKHHHDLIHAQGWTLTLGTGRQLTITLLDGTIMTNAPNRAA